HPRQQHHLARHAAPFRRHPPDQHRGRRHQPRRRRRNQRSHAGGEHRLPLAERAGDRRRRHARRRRPRRPRRPDRPQQRLPANLLRRNHPPEQRDGHGGRTLRREPLLQQRRFAPVVPPRRNDHQLGHVERQG